LQACSRYGCEELVAAARGRFLAAGGEKAWLEGLHRAAPKVRRLATLNKVLAHRPWALDQTHLKELTTGQDSWSLAEIVQAIGECRVETKRFIARHVFVKTSRNWRK
jgi:sestrin